MLQAVSFYPCHHRVHSYKCCGLTRCVRIRPSLVISERIAITVASIGSLLSTTTPSSLTKMSSKTQMCADSEECCERDLPRKYWGNLDHGLSWSDCRSTTIERWKHIHFPSETLIKNLSLQRLEWLRREVVTVKFLLLGSLQFGICSYLELLSDNGCPKTKG